MKQSIPISRIFVGAVLGLALLMGCDQQGGAQLTQMSELFAKKIAEKDKELAEARTAQQVALAQKAEFEGKLSAMQAELDRAHGAPSLGTVATGPGISTEKLSAQLATALEPTIRKALQQAVAALPASAGTNTTVANPPVNPNPTGTTNRRAPRETPVADAPPPRTPKEPETTDTGEPKRPTGNTTKIPIEFPPLNGPR